MKPRSETPGPVPPPLLHLPPGTECPGCGRPIDSPSIGQMDVWLQTQTVVGAEQAALSYCAACADRLMAVGLDEITGEMDIVIRGKLGKGIPISEPLVREIAANLGVSDRLKDALIERIFGKDWDGRVPEGAMMNRFANRDRLVAFVAAKLKDLWTLEA